MRLAIEAVRNSGWPVLVVDDEGRLLGIVGIDELLESFAAARTKRRLNCGINRFKEVCICFLLWSV